MRPTIVIICLQFSLLPPQELQKRRDSDVALASHHKKVDDSFSGARGAIPYLFSARI